MNRHLVLATLLTPLVLLASGASLAQSPSPPVPTLTPAPSYQPLPAADPVAAVDAWLDALVARQWTQLPGLTCQAERGAVASFYDARLSEDPGTGGGPALHRHHEAGDRRPVGDARGHRG